MKKPRASPCTRGSRSRTPGREVSVTFKAARMIAVTGAEGRKQKAEGRGGRLVLTASVVRMIVEETHSLLILLRQLRDRSDVKSLTEDAKTRKKQCGELS